MIERQSTPKTQTFLNAFKPRFGQRILALEQLHEQSILGPGQMTGVADEKKEYENLKHELGPWYGLARILAHAVHSLQPRPEKHVEPQITVTSFYPVTGLTIKYDSIQDAVRGQNGKVIPPEKR